MNYTIDNNNPSQLDTPIKKLDIRSIPNSHPYNSNKENQNSEPTSLSSPQNPNFYLQVHHIERPNSFISKNSSYKNEGQQEDFLMDTFDNNKRVQNNLKHNNDQSALIQNHSDPMQQYDNEDLNSPSIPLEAKNNNNNVLKEKANSHYIQGIITNNQNSAPEPSINKSRHSKAGHHRANKSFDIQGFDNQEADMNSEITWLYKELDITKKALEEVQSKATSINKERSQLKYECNMINVQFKKSESKCNELIKKHSEDQAKINELTFVNNQITNELQGLRKETNANIDKHIESSTTLKQNLCELEKSIENRNSEILKNAKKIQMSLMPLFKLIDTTLPNLTSKCLPIFEKIENFLNLIIRIASSDNCPEFGTSSNKLKDIDTLRSMQETIEKLEIKNNLLKQDIHELMKQLAEEREKEKVKEDDELTEYRESINKLKKITNMLRSKMEELTEKHELERNQLYQKLEITQKEKEKLIEDNTSLYHSNDNLREKIKDLERIVNNKDDKIYQLTDENMQINIKIRSLEAMLKNLSRLEDDKSGQGFNHRSKSPLLKSQKPPRNNDSFENITPESYDMYVASMQHDNMPKPYKNAPRSKNHNVHENSKEIDLNHGPLIYDNQHTQPNDESEMMSQSTKNKFYPTENHHYIKSQALLPQDSRAKGLNDDEGFNRGFRPRIRQHSYRDAPLIELNRSYANENSVIYTEGNDYEFKKGSRRVNETGHREFSKDKNYKKKVSMTENSFETETAEYQGCDYHQLRSSKECFRDENPRADTDGYYDLKWDEKSKHHDFRRSSHVTPAKKENNDNSNSESALKNELSYLNHEIEEIERFLI